MPNAIPAWFDADWYAQQKVAQMNATGYAPEWLAENGAGATAWTVALYQAYLDQYTLNGAHVSAWDNFQVVNQGGYDTAEIGLEDINVSPNALFNIPVYLQSLANYNNANPDVYGAPAGGGEWTMQSELEEIFNKYQASVWEHYNTNWDKLLDINPSNDFDTQAYLQLRAEAMGDGATVEDAVAAIKGAGLNPIQDFYINGASLNITSAPAVEAGTEINPADSSWNQWSEAPVEPIGTDPYDQNYVTEAIVQGQTGPYEGQAGQNTWFEAAWSGTGAAASTLNAKDVITGGENALNSLVVDLDNNWQGFSGTGDDPFNPQPNVTNVGRVVLNHNEAHSEASWTFNAKNISADAVRYDLNATGAGVINMQELNGAVERINISDLVRPNVNTNTSTTTLGWQIGAHTGNNDSLTIGVSNVFAEGGSHKITGLADIENITVDAMGGTNNIDLSDATHKNFTVEGAGNLSLATDATGTKSYDASAATGNVDFKFTAGLASQTIAGGSGNDTVTLNGSMSSVKAANWTSIENLTFADGSSTVNAKGLVGLENIWVGTSGTSVVNNLTADNITIYQGLGDGGITVNGGTLGNLGWVSNSGKSDTTAVKAQVTSNATGDVNIELTGEDVLADGSKFDVSKATGTITINSPNAPSAMPTVTLVAGKATGLNLDVTGALTIDGTNSKLGSVQNVNINLTNDSDPADTFSLTSALTAARQVQIAAGEENVTLGQIGDENGVGFELQIQDANKVTVGNMLADLGGNITALIQAEGDVTLGSRIVTKTNTSANGEGNVRVSVETAGNVSATTAVEGGQLYIDFSGVEGTVGAGGGITLAAEEYIQYQGAAGADTVTITQIGKTSTSNQIQLGDGADNLTINISDSAKAVNGATISVDLGSGDLVTDTVTVTSVKGLLKLNITSVETGDKVNVSALTAASGDDIEAILDKFGMASLADSFGGNNTYTTDGGIVYGLYGDANDGVLIVLSGEDAAAGDFVTA